MAWNTSIPTKQHDLCFFSFHNLDRRAASRKSEEHIHRLSVARYLHLDLVFGVTVALDFRLLLGGGFSTRGGQGSSRLCQVVRISSRRCGQAAFDMTTERSASFSGDR